MHKAQTNATNSITKETTMMTSLHEKVGLVHFVTNTNTVNKVTTEEDDDEEEEYQYWPAIIFADLQDYEQQRNGLQQILRTGSSTSAIASATTSTFRDAEIDIQNHKRHQLLLKKKQKEATEQPQPRINQQQRHRVAFLLGPTLPSHRSFWRKHSDNTNDDIDNDNASDTTKKKPRSQRLVFEDDSTVLDFVTILSSTTTHDNDNASHEINHGSLSDDLSACPNSSNSTDEDADTDTESSTDADNIIPPLASSSSTLVAEAFREAASVLLSFSSSSSLYQDGAAAAVAMVARNCSIASLPPLSTSASFFAEVDQKNEPEFSVKRLCFFNIRIQKKKVPVANTTTKEEEQEQAHDDELTIPWPAILIQEMGSFPEAVMQHKLKLFQANIDRFNSTSTSNRMLLYDYKATASKLAAPSTGVAHENDTAIPKDLAYARRVVNKLRKDEQGLLWKDTVQVLLEGSRTGVFLFGDPPITTSTVVPRDTASSKKSKRPPRSQKIVPYSTESVRSATALSYAEIARYCNIIPGYQEASNEATFISNDTILRSIVRDTRTTTVLGVIPPPMAGNYNKIRKAIGTTTTADSDTDAKDDDDDSYDEDSSRSNKNNRHNVSLVQCPTTLAVTRTKYAAGAAITQKRGIKQQQQQQHKKRRTTNSVSGRTVLGDVANKNKVEGSTMAESTKKANIRQNHPSMIAVYSNHRRPEP